VEFTVADSWFEIRDQAWVEGKLRLTYERRGLKGEPNIALDYAALCNRNLHKGRTG